MENLMTVDPMIACNVLFQSSSSKFKLDCNGMLVGSSQTRRVSIAIRFLWVLLDGTKDIMGVLQHMSLHVGSESDTLAFEELLDAKFFHV